MLTESWNGSGSASAKISEGSIGTCSSAPSAPTGLTATATSSSQINLSWAAVTPPSNCSVTYSVFRNGAQVATGLTGTSYSNTGLTPSTLYQFYVRAVDSAGSSANSATVSATTQGGTTYPLTVTSTGGGTVTSSTGGINCGTVCSANIASGTAVTLTATSPAGGSFTGWSGACIGTGSCIVTMTAAQSVSAAFTGGSSGDVVSINAGGSATGSFVADGYFSGGSTYSTTNAIDTSLLTGVAVPPQAVLQTERYGEFTYTVTGRTAGSAQTVTLYFEESYWTAAGQRTFDVAIGGQTVLTAFDIYAAAGGTNKAVARSFSTTASASGQVVIAFSKGGGPDNPKVSGITVAAGGTGQSTFPLTVSKSGSGTVSGSGIACGTTCSATYTSGTSVSLTATPDAGATFTGWGGACSGTGSCIVTMSSAQSVTATFTGGSNNTPCANPVTFTGQSGNFNTTGAVCYRISGAVNGWGCSNFAGRTVSVNGGTVTSSCGAGPFPLAKSSDGYTYFSVSAGTYAWASIYTW